MSRDWTRPSPDMTELANVGGAMLQRACTDLGLPTWGQKFKLADRLLDVGMTADLVRARYSWRAMQGVSEQPKSSGPIVPSVTRPLCRCSCHHWPYNSCMDTCCG